MTINKNYTSPSTDGMLLQTRMVNPLEPDSFEPELEEICLALPNINRYNGHTIFPYSVAQHSLYCALVGETAYNLCRPHEQLMLLLHDGAEAYLQDIIRPIKRHTTDLLLEAEQQITNKIMAIVLQPLNLLQDWHTVGVQQVISEIDTRMAVTEIQQLIPKWEDPLPKHLPYPLRIAEYHHSAVRGVYIEAIITNMRRMLDEQGQAA